MDAPTRGVTNAISAYVKDMLYPPRSRREERQVLDPLAGLAESVERTAPTLLKWLMIGGITIWVLKQLNQGGGGGFGGGGGSKCRCVEWRCD